MKVSQKYKQAAEVESLIRQGAAKSKAVKTVGISASTYYNIRKREAYRAWLKSRDERTTTTPLPKTGSTAVLSEDFLSRVISSNLKTEDKVEIFKVFIK